MAPRWQKALGDIAARPGRSALAVLAMTIGVFALGTLAFKMAILRPVLATMYGRTHPASATLVTDAIDDSVVAAVRAMPGVGDAEARPTIVARVRVGSAGKEEWIPAILFVVRDFERLRVDLFTSDGCSWPPGDDQILLERSAVRVAGARVGDPLALRIPGGDEGSLRFAGTVHAAGLAPAWMEHVVYGFIPWTSAVRQGPHRESAQLKIVVADHELDEGHIREVADRVRAELEARGHEVSRVDVPTPGRHPHAAQMDTFLYLLGAFGLLAFLLSSVLVASMIHSLQAEQVRQVGMMKAIGATSGQIAGIYLAHVGMLATIALAIGVPLAWTVGSAYARFSANILNADVSGSPFPWGMLALVIAAGLLVPLLAALGPVGRAARISVHQALTEELAPRAFGDSRLERWLVGVAGLPRPLVLMLRTTFLRRGRLALTVGMLAIGGAMFMAAVNVSAGWNRAVQDDFARRRYDLSLVISQRRPVPEIAAILATVPGVDRTESWSSASAWLIGPDGAAGSRISLLGLEPASPLLAMRVIAGRWLDPTRANGVVVNNAVVALNPKLRAGGTVGVRLDGRTHELPIVGVVKEMSPQPLIYAGRGVITNLTGDTGDSARTYRIVTHQHTDAAQLAVARELEQTFASRGYEVTIIQRMGDAKKGILDHLVIIMVILTLSASIVVLVGAIGLTSTLTINVVQRTREIGVMSAIGATPRTIAGQIWGEAIVIGLLSWLVATVLTMPVTWILQTVTGRMFFRIPLDFTLAGGALGLWLGLVVVLSSISSFYPAWRAARLTVREAMAHV